MEPRRPSRWSPFEVFATALLFVGPVRIHAQIISTAVCQSSFDWMNNSENQNPCLVSGYLGGACSNGEFTVPALAPGAYYAGPLPASANSCQCSSVTYNTLSACGLCQNRSIISWSVWYFNCSTIYPGVFTPGIPVGTSVPQWAFQNVTASDLFNVTLAQVVGDTPESTAIAQSTAIAASTLTSAQASLTSSASALPINAASSQNKTNTGAIAGGVIGGVVGIALIVAAIVFFIMRRKRSHIPPSAMFAALPSPGYSDSAFPFPMTQPKLYDPSDPSTYPPVFMTGFKSGTKPDVQGAFPGSPHLTTTMNKPSIPHSTINYSYPSVMRPGGGQTGLPEV